ncbi:molybdopterin-dependent oxidoreductase [Methyloligella sp. GL2]|nr:molybdopterin-dependent oxidoreductase [Methyloligella sp. GL2]
MSERATPRFPSRRSLLKGLGIGALALSSAASFARRSLAETLAEETTRLPLPGGPDTRKLTTSFPEKGEMILQRTRPPLLETPFEVFDKGIFTPNDRFYVRWHWAVIPTDVDAAAFRLKLHGAVNTPLELSLPEILELPRIEMAAVNQCSGNSRGFFQPRVPGGEWGNGAMGNALWTGVRLKDLLDKAGVKPGAVQVRFTGLDNVLVPDAPRFVKSLDIDHARDGEVMIAYAMNGTQLPLLNGFPLRVVVPGWYSTYWIKSLEEIEVLDKPDDNFWMAKAYKIPDTPGANMKPGETGVPMVPISKMVPRSFLTNLTDGAEVAAGKPQPLRGIAFGGDCGVARIDISTDGGKSWQPAKLGADHGRYSFRGWQAEIALPKPGSYSVMVRCTNTDGLAQPMTPNWNGGGYMRNVVEETALTFA